MTLLGRVVFIFAIILGLGVAENLSSSRPHTMRVGQKSVPVAHKVSLHDVWLPSSPFARQGASGLTAIGRGKGIVFSPDLSEPGNCDFFRALGFACFQDPDWHKVIKEIREFNESHPEDRIETLLIESHGTNGDALKLQHGKDPTAPRSYIAPAALQEQLHGTGVRVCLLAACNAGRLFRQENYLTVRGDPDNHLFEPATLGMINASANFDSARNSVTVVRRVESHIEVINECRVSELSPGARAEVIKQSNGRLQPATEIAVPEMLIQLLLKDENLHLVAWGQEMEKSRDQTKDHYREHLISQFLQYVNARADQK